ncbi:hypothetical protein BDW66DRAFT_164512 [Aspergillus desertorum]
MVPSLQWHKIAPGQYQRPFDTSERLYRGAGASGAHLGTQHFLVGSAIQLKDALSISDVHRAWIALRHKRPHIAAVADGSGSKSAETVEPDLKPADLFMLHCLPRSRQLLFRAPHWRTDGRGMILLQDEFSRCSPRAQSQGTLTGLSYEVTPEMARASDAVLSVLVSGSTPLSVKESLASGTPKKSRRAAISLPPDLSAAIIAASKARAQTVTTTVHAALVTALRHHADTAGRRLICFNPFDVRDRLPAPWNTSAGCASLYHTGKPCSIDLAQLPNFDAVAAHLSAFYHEDLQPLFGHMVDYHRKIGEALAMPLEAALQMPGAARPELSSLGVIDSFLRSSYRGPAGTFEIEDWFLGVQIITRLLQMYLWTRDGSMQLACHYNEGFYESKIITCFLEEWKQVLITELVGGT